ncbi:MAG TPA: regulatory iron-sulfur-containing complex subunit RicT, partial [Bacteroidales bacterium]
MSCSNCTFNKIQAGDQEITINNLVASNSSYDWLGDLPDSPGISNIVEVRFKNNRKGFYRNINNIKLAYNDIVAVQVNGGYDVGIVSLKGLLAEKQLKRKNLNTDYESLGNIYRKATESDIKNWMDGKKHEKEALVKSRQMAQNLNLDMKISEVEYQGDNKKATIFFISDNRVDFRELVKLLVKELNVKIEMRQIGARQEAGKIGGIGSCGKELCCSSWRTTFPTVSASSIPAQQLNSNIEKYTGQCGKLKCCLMYELATYLEAKSDFPKELLELETKKGIAFPLKIDILQKTVWYTFKKDDVTEAATEVKLDRVKEI